MNLLNFGRLFSVVLSFGLSSDEVAQTLHSRTSVTPSNRTLLENLLAQVVKIFPALCDHRIFIIMSQSKKSKVNLLVTSCTKVCGKSKMYVFLKDVHKVLFLCSVSLLTNKIHYLSNNTVIRVLLRHVSVLF